MDTSTDNVTDNSNSDATYSVVVWKWEVEEADGEGSGPVWIDTMRQGSTEAIKTEEWDHWVRRSEAEAYAKEHGFEFIADE